MEIEDRVEVHHYIAAILLTIFLPPIGVLCWLYIFGVIRWQVWSFLTWAVRGYCRLLVWLVQGTYWLLLLGPRLIIRFVTWWASGREARAVAARERHERWERRAQVRSDIRDRKRRERSERDQQRQRQLEERTQAAAELARQSEEACERAERDDAERLRREEEEAARALRERPAAREAALLFYVEHAPRIGDAFPRALFQDYLRTRMSDDLPCREVVAAGKELQETLERIVIRSEAREMHEGCADMIGDRFSDDMLDLFLRDSMGDDRNIEDVRAAASRLRDMLRRFLEESPLQAQRRKNEMTRARREREEAEEEKLRAMGMTDDMIELEMAERRHRNGSPVN